MLDQILHVISTGSDELGFIALIGLCVLILMAGFVATISETLDWLDTNTELKNE